ncbi:MAG: DNA mismatch repair protein MutS, partial [Opitutales bacterium]|nr:DNA mismatch repair protein MutS [Opitutales bacterium]
MSADLNKTPMIQQYWEFRNKLPPNTLLFFRVGDFYEMFGSDAERGAELLGVTLTKRSGLPLAGVPYHALQTYLQKALNAGVKIAICEQTEAAKPGKLVNRALVRIITPGTTLEDTQLDAKHNNYILAIDENRHGLHAAWLDVSTAEFRIATSRERTSLLSVLLTLRPSEILVPESWQQGRTPEYLDALLQWNLVSRTTDWQFDPKIGNETVCKVLKVNSLDGFGVSEKNPALGVAGALLNYVSETLCETPEHIKKISELHSDDAMIIDAAGTRNLELFRSASGTRDGSLLAAIDGTHTAAGARLLERWLASPSRDIRVIRERQDCVEAFFKSHTVMSRVLIALAYVKDITRTLTRLQNRLRSPRELGIIRESLAQLPEIKQALEIISP